MPTHEERAAAERSCHAAASKGDLAALTQLVERGVDVDATDEASAAAPHVPRHTSTHPPTRPAPTPHPHSPPHTAAPMAVHTHVWNLVVRTLPPTVHRRASRPS